MSVSNFNFLATEFPALAEAAQRAERYVHSDARVACISGRFALERAVQWLYESDKRLTLPYDTNLGALLHEPSFQQVIPTGLFHKMRVIQKAGNLAARSQRMIKQWDALQVVKELHHVLYWLARTYHRQPLEMEVEFDPNLLPSPETAPRPPSEAEQQTIAAQLADKARELKEREEQFEAMEAEITALQTQVAAARERNEAKADTHDYSEAETRHYLIDLDLKRSGWALDQVRDREYEVSGMPNNQGIGFVDYVFWGDNGMPLAVVEAKRTTSDAAQGRQQAKLYADCLEKMTGRRPVIYYSNGYQTHLWDDDFYPPRPVSGYHTRDELELMIQRRTTRLPVKDAQINEEIVERYYQKRAIKALAESFSQKQRKGLLVMATGTGKTRTAIALVDLLQRSNWVKRALFLADRVSLVRQAVNAFKTHLPGANAVNLVTEKDKDGRVYVCTYPTVMGLIDETKDGVARFGPGFFDLVIIDEAHRSVYQKYGAIFSYFDSLLLGLTATPRDQIDRNTYDLFDLESGVPTDAYELNQGVHDGYLVPPKATQVDLKFPRDGIHYDELTPEEQEEWESLDWGDRGDGDQVPRQVNAAAINQWLFNKSTVDQVLRVLMEEGHKVEGGDRLAKTIIFARNHDHATFIEERFDRHYPHLKGSFARVIDNKTKYVQSLIDDFSQKDGPPHIAISVDMLDTGIDVPEVANLVFFKPVYSKIKFWQMIGRGTRLCPNMFGPGMDKTDFRVFDFCFNFAFFKENPDGIEANDSEPLGKRLFKHRLQLVRHFSGNSCDHAGADELRTSLVRQLHTEVAAMPHENFLVRMHFEPVERFQRPENWRELEDDDFETLASEVAGLPTTLPAEKLEAKMFDLRCLRMQLALVEDNRRLFEAERTRVVDMAMELEAKATIPAVKEQLEYLQALQTVEFWEGVGLPQLEELRKRLRGLASLIDEGRLGSVYTNFEDELVGMTAMETVPMPKMTSAQFEKKVQEYLKGHLDHVAVQKLRMNEPLTPTDLQSLETVLTDIGAEDGPKLLKHLMERQETPQPALFREDVGRDEPLSRSKALQYLPGRPHAHHGSNPLY
ncbi:MAG: DEAD/DEAH box helicase family protein [Opitutales bacterium]